MKRSGSILRAGVATLLALWIGTIGWSRQVGPGEGAAVVVEGKILGAYQSAVPEQEGLLVEVQTRRSELGTLPLGNARVDVPSPGDLVYVHVAAMRGRVALPAPGSEVRVFLVPRNEGGWQGRADTWFEPLNAPEPQPTPRPIPDRTPAAPAPAGASALDLLGLSADELDVQGKYVLRVTAIERGKPASQAGLEVGDIVIGYDGQPLGSPEALAARVAKGGTISLMVVDINTGKVAQVPVELGRLTAQVAPPAGAPTSRAEPAPEPIPVPPTAPRRSLGITAEPVTVNGRTALKVARVDPNGPGGKAGLEPGDILVAANGAALTGPEQLAAALRKSGPVMSLTVRDTRTGKDVPVEVNFGEPVTTSAPTPAPVPVPTPTPARTGAGGGLGAVTELVFLDTEAAVKVTEVVPNSPAAKAGLEPGDIIVEAGGKPVLHPNELTEAVRQASGSIQLTVLAKGSGRRTTVKVDLGR